MESPFFERVKEWLTTQGVTEENATKVGTILQKRHNDLVGGFSLQELEVIATHFNQASNK
jgi:hypothetical protein